mgnify:CR=1 FL=1
MQSWFLSHPNVARFVKKKQACQNEVILLFIFIDSTGTEEADSTRTRRGDHNSPPLQGYERVRKFGKKAMFQVQLTNKFFPNEILDLQTYNVARYTNVTLIN